MNAKMNGRKRKSFDKPLCKYGLSCYQKNPEHHKKFKHPPKEDNEVNKNSLKDVIEVITTSEESVSDTAENVENDSFSSLNNEDCDDIRLEETVGEILKSMPKDFFDFWKFCISVNKSYPQDAFSDIGYSLVGVYDLLSKKLPFDMKVDISLHWRYFYDPPEFQTIIKKDGKDLYHIGYFRDDPSEMPSILASNSAALGERLTLMGDNIFCAMNVELTKILKTSQSKSMKSKASKLQESLLEFASQKKYSKEVQTNKTKQRQKKVVTKTFHGLGIVVPVKNDVGYRPLPDSNATLKKILKKIVTAESEDKRLEEEEFLDEIITNVHFANDECDYGMGFELGIDLFCYGHPYIDKTASAILTLAYNLLKRPKYASIAKIHLKNRKKDVILNTFDA